MHYYNVHSVISLEELGNGKPHNAQVVRMFISLPLYFLSFLKMPKKVSNILFFSFYNQKIY